MKKYLQAARNVWESALVYRLNFTMWRVRNVLLVLTTYYLWLVVVPANKPFLGYSQSLMLTYILGASFISSMVLSSRSFGIGEEINNGDLSIYLLRPINFFYYAFAKDMGDKAMNIMFSIVELTILFTILRPPLFIQHNIFVLLSAIFSTLIGIFLYFCINVLMGFIGFWSPETWAPRFILTILISFLGGGSFPLDILPKEIYSMFKLLPFTYLQYFPLKIYLGQLSLLDGMTGAFISIAWVGILVYLIKYLWIKGLKSYTAYGR